MLHLEINVKRRHIYALIAAVALIVTILPVASWASHTFNDVPDSNIFHEDITWLADAEVTLGCNPPTNDEFCPGDVVRRETMAAFMRRLAENQVVDAKTAIEAENADTLDGMDSTDLMTQAFSLTGGTTTVPASGSADILAMDLEAGSYLINARVSLNQNGGTAGRNITCTLTAGTTVQTLVNFWTEPNGGIDTLENSFMIVHTFDAAGQAVLSCAGGANWSGNIVNPAITAITVNEITASTAGGTAGENTNG
ncbi:MAG: hypothetical protein ACR2NG_07500 [Acidimicrobiia bacterium]